MHGNILTEHSVDEETVRPNTKVGILAGESS